MPSVMELVGHGARKRDAENLDVTDGGVQETATGAGYGIPSRRVRREKRRAAGRVCLSLARRYNTLDLAGKVSVPRGCGPFGNPGEKGRRDGCFPSGAATGAFQTVAACRGIMFSGGWYRDCVWAAGQRGAALSAKVVLPTMTLSVFLRNSVKCRGPERSASGHRAGALLSAHPDQRREAVRLMTWIPALRGWCALVRFGARGIARYEDGDGIVVRMSTKEHHQPKLSRASSRSSSSGSSS